MLGRPGPEDDAVARVLKGRLDAGVLDAQQKRVDEDLVKVGREETGALLGVARGPVGGIAGLDLGLEEGEGEGEGGEGA